MTAPNDNTTASTSSPRFITRCFPSGLTVANARKEASKRLQNQQANTMVEALNYISTREMGLRWHDAIAKLTLTQETSEQTLDKQTQTKEPNKSHTANLDTTNKRNSNENHSNENNNRNNQATPEEQGNAANPAADFLARNTQTEVKHYKKTEKITLIYQFSNLQLLLKNYPNIGFSGIFSEQTSSADKSKERALLSISLNSFNLAYHFLNQCNDIKSINKKLSASQLTAIFKQKAVRSNLITAEEQLAEGAIIICAQELGYSMKCVDNEVYFNISSRSSILK